MGEDGTWGGGFELSVLNTPVYSFQGGDDNYWLTCFPHGIDQRIPEHTNLPFIYIH